MSEPTRDMRGVVIERGAIVIYGAAVGRASSLVVGRVVANRGRITTPGGRVRVRVIERRFDYGMSADVTVNPDRLMVVNPLPRAVPGHMRVTTQPVAEVNP